MSELSPTAQAVLDAAVTKATLSKKLAAALRAVADEVVPADGSRKNNEIRAELLTIATELDGTNTIN
jgi:hypothetical protein